LVIGSSVRAPSHVVIEAVRRCLL